MCDDFYYQIPFTENKNYQNGSAHFWEKGIEKIILAYLYINV